MIRKTLHDLSILQYHYSQGLGYLGSCRIFSIHRSPKFRCWWAQNCIPRFGNCPHSRARALHSREQITGICVFHEDIHRVILRLVLEFVFFVGGGSLGFRSLGLRSHSLVVLPAVGESCMSRTKAKLEGNQGGSGMLMPT